MPVQQLASYDIEGHQGGSQFENVNGPGQQLWSPRHLCPVFTLSGFRQHTVVVRSHIAQKFIYGKFYLVIKFTSTRSSFTV